MSKKVQPASREFDALVRAIGDCKSKAEEDAIISREVEVLKAHVKDPRVDERHTKEILVRLMYVEMLGHDASWGHVTALRACSSKLLLTKKVAYLASTLFLDSGSELIVLIVNTLTHDLTDDNFLIVCSALTVVTRLIGLDMIAAVLAPVVALLTHSREIVRKKAVAVLHRFEQLDPSHDGPLAGADVESNLCRMLCDKDPSVMGAVLCALGEVAPRNPGSFRNLAPSFVSILKQITDGLLHKSYDYHKVPAPFLQIKLLRLLAVVGAGDIPTSEAMYGVVGAAMTKAAAHGSTIGNAIVYEAARTVTTIHPNTSLLQSAADIIATFLRATSHNLKYIGIDVLARMVRINPKYAAEHQLAVVDCLEDKDDALKKKTLELLYKMAKPNNVEVIVEKMVEYLRGCNDEVAKADVVNRISDLAERYAPDTFWFIDTMNHVFELGGDAVPPAMAAGLTRLISEGGGADGSGGMGDTQMRSEVVASYLDLLQRPKLSDVLLTVILWVLGEYGNLADIGAAGVLAALGTLAEQRPPSELVRGYLLSAIAKLSTQSGEAVPAAVQMAVEDAAASRNTDLQQRAVELQALLRCAPAVRMAALPSDASAEDVEVDAALPFLDGFVAAAVQNGAAPYLPAVERREMGVVRGSGQDEASAAAAALKPINFKAYERPVLPKPPQPPPLSVSSQTGLIGQLPGASGVQGGGGPAAPPLLLRKAGGGRWGPTPSASQPPLLATPAAASSVAGSTTAQSDPRPAFKGGISSSAGGAGPHPVPPPRPAETAEQDAQRAERERRAAALFGGGSGDGETAHNERHSRQTTSATAPRRPAQPRQQASQEAPLMSVNTASPQPTASITAPAVASAGDDLLGGLEDLNLDGVSAPDIHLPSQQQAGGAHHQSQQLQQPGSHGGADLVNLLGGSNDTITQYHEATNAITDAYSDYDLLGLSPEANLTQEPTASQQPAPSQQLPAVSKQQPAALQPKSMRPSQTTAPPDPFAGLF